VRRQTASAAVVLLVAGFLIYALGTTLNYHRYSHDVIEEMMYFPSGTLLDVASVGYETLVADMLWLRGIQYYGEHRRTDRSYPLAEHVFSTITDLDPRFIGAYRFGAFVLGQDVGQPAAGIDLIKKGMRHNPGNWQLPFDLGFLYFIQMDDSRTAAHFFNFAARQEGAPELAKRFSAFAYRKAGKNRMAKALWEEIYHSSDNPVMRETAEHALKNIIRDELADSLEIRIERFLAGKGRRPDTLGELVEAGLLRRVPRDPYGGRYFIDSVTGKVWSTSAVSETAERTGRYVQRLLDRYYDQHGHYPGRLEDLVKEGLVQELPRVSGTSITYDSSEGVVRYILSTGGEHWD
jgi:hypothetical protein